MGQCVEFFYLSKKLQDKQKKQKEEENRDGEMQQQKNVRRMFKKTSYCNLFYPLFPGCFLFSGR